MWHRLGRRRVVGAAVEKGPNGACCQVLGMVHWMTSSRRWEGAYLRIAFSAAGGCCWWCIDGGSHPHLDHSGMRLIRLLLLLRLLLLSLGPFLLHFLAPLLPFSSALAARSIRLPGAVTLQQPHSTVSSCS
jgi:hypothetical protein